MKKNGISILMVLLVGVGALNLMCFILRLVSTSRIACGSLNQTIMQNRINVIAILGSLLGVVILRWIIKKECN